MASHRNVENKKAKTVNKPDGKKVQAKKHNSNSGRGQGSVMANLQQSVGNRAVQRLVQRDQGIAQSGGQLSPETSDRIDRETGRGRPLDEGVQREMGHTMGHDFSNVVVHTDEEAHTLNRELDSHAFAVGNDLFFREGNYDPHSKDGKELIAHELTHVVQQREGEVEESGGSGLNVNKPGDAHEQEADSLAKKAASGDKIQRDSEEEVMAKAVQRQDMPEEEEIMAKAVQRQDMPEEEEIMAKAVQRQDMPEEEEIMAKAVQRQDMPEEEEIMAKAVQRQDMPEEEEVMAKAVQRQDMPEEEEVMAKAVQRQDMPEEEEVMAKAVQRQDMPEEEEIMAKAVQRQDMPEEEEIMAKAVQRDELEEAKEAETIP